MQETLNSLVRLSAAIAVFGVQQVQTAVGSANTKDSGDKMREVIDGMAAAVSAQIDEIEGDAGVTATLMSALTMLMLALL